METARKLARKLRNIGPRMAQRMVDAGIDSVEALHALGAREAFVRMYPEGDNYGDFNAAYLYALEGAIRDCDGHELPADIREELKGFAKELQSKAKP